ncbi:unnamed protein product, partial [Musa textilis]
VCSFELYRPVRAVRTGPTGYRYADRPLPGGTYILADTEAYRAVRRHTERYGGVPSGVPTDTEVYRSVRPSMIPSVCHSVPTVRIGTYRTDQLSVHRYGTVLRTLIYTTTKI